MATGAALPTVAVVIPNWNGSRWLPQCLDSLAAQTHPVDEVVVVDNGSTDGSIGLATAAGLRVRVIELGRNTGFAFAANRGIDAVDSQAVALVNTDVTLAPDWVARMVAALARDDRVAAVACKMVDMQDPQLLYDAGDLLRRDGACEQRGRFESDDGRFDSPDEVFAACAGAAVYRRAAVTSVGGFDEHLFSYIEDVDLGLRLRLAGWQCSYEPVVARHAAGGSSWQLRPPVEHWVERNTLLLVAKAFPLRWAPYVIYRQIGWALHALLERRLRAHLSGAMAALPLLPHAVRERRRLHRESVVRIEAAVPPRPIRRASGAQSAKRPRNPGELG
jgi:GT2 family glycosyltransferase